MPTFNKPKQAENKPIVIKRKTHWKLWLLYGIFMMTLIAMAGYGVKSFFDKYYIVSPIQSRIVTPLPDPIATTSAVMKPQKQAFKVYVTEPVYANSDTASQIADKIFTLESSRGRNDGCRDQGKFNGYGFIVGSCYDTHEEVANKVIQWFEVKLKIYDLPTALCGYNLGFNSEHLQDCVNQSNEYPYYKDYLSL